MNDTKTPGRTPDEQPANGQVETRDWHPDEQPGDSPDAVDGESAHFTPDEADAIQLYIDQLKVLLGLERWDVFLSATPSDEGTNASVHPVYGRHVVPIAVNKDWWSYSPRVQRNTLVHELLHVVHNRQTEVIRTTAQTKAVWTTFERETELMVDHLAGVLDVYMPWPIKPDDVALMRSMKTGPFAEESE
ncbi:hypothetical protein SEA_KARATE_9 [Microbacterium phage Karate]|nr:hypothetical protein SEA_KARATE_9 [Microbacterium phage Karate]